ncbi:tryptophan-rich sensory protein [Paenibacillus agaridevorans]|uniref:tryptophan-rich sensory protein n=1 Tax=Paenibacillus agaridevorans TaxID=171404 RepID=UPI001BE48BC0|nr:tryptophan-rich sensory protein [Paenibacillus agaridevorans]
MRYVHAIGLVLVLVMNVLAQRLPLGGRTTGELSAKYPSLVTPAGYAFSIWLLIYAFLIGFVIYSFTHAGRNSKAVQAVGFYFPLSCVFNAGWLLAWHYEYVNASVFVMLALLLTIIAIYTRVRAAGETYVSMGERWFVRVPFSLYLGWICVATIVNISSALHASKWDGFGLSETLWAPIVLAVGAVIALAIAFTRRDAVAPLVFVWAYVAICMKQQDHPAVVYTAAVLAVVLAAAAVLAFLRSMRTAS